MSEQMECTGTPCDCAQCQSMTLNQFQHSMHTYKKAHEECHALGIVGELAEVVEQLLPTTVTSDHTYAGQLRATTVFCAAGRIADMVKKQQSHAVALDRNLLMKELGDVLWYIAAVANDNNLTLEEIAQANIAKLRARYPTGFEKGGGVREETVQPSVNLRTDIKGICSSTRPGPEMGDCVRPAGHRGSHRSYNGNLWEGQ